MFCEFFAKIFATRDFYTTFLHKFREKSLQNRNLRNINPYPVVKNCRSGEWNRIHRDRTGTLRAQGGSGYAIRPRTYARLTPLRLRFLIPLVVLDPGTSVVAVIVHV